MVSIKLDNIRKEFVDLVAVNDVTLDIGEGELFFLLGPSGCGKTTILRLIAGFIEADGGRILFDDKDVTTLPPHKRNAAMVFQNYALWPHMTVLENVGYGLEIKKMPRKEREKRVAEALDLVQMKRYETHYPHELSGGQQQRVAVARALVVEPDVLLMDEPLSNLDARLRLEMRNEIRRIHDETNLTIVYVTHDQTEALSLAQQIAVLNRGVLQQVGRPEELYLSPGNRFVAQFIGDINVIPGTVVSEAPVTVRTAVGDVRTNIADGFKTDESVVCGFRPESIMTESAQAPGANPFSGKIRSVVFNGSFIEYELELSDELSLNICALSRREHLFEQGADLSVSVKPEHIMLLRDET